MEQNGLAIDTNAPVGAPPAAAAPPPPMPEPVATPAMPPPAMPATPLSTAGSGEGESFSDFLKSLNWIEMGFMILGAAGLYYTIFYYRYKLKEDKVANMDMRRQIDELKMNVQPALKGKYKTL